MNQSVHSHVVESTSNKGIEYKEKRNHRIFTNEEPNIDTHPILAISDIALHNQKIILTLYMGCFKYSI